MNLFYPTEIIPDKTIHRFNRDSKDRKKCGWYICFRNHSNSGEEYYVCVYCDWREGEKHTFVSGHSSTPEEKKKVEKQIRQASEKLQKELTQKQEEAAVDAEEEFAKLADTGTSAYLTEKGLRHVPGIKYHADYLAVPLSDHSGKLWAIQRVIPGSKSFGLGSRVKGNYFRIEGDSSIIICEGIGTGISIHMATGATVICAFSAHNLPEVARHFVGQSVTIAADNDVSETGLKYAEKAAELSDKFRIVLAHPKKGSDFNDVHLESGLDAVREYFETNEKAVEMIVDKKAAIYGDYPNVTDKGIPIDTIDNLRELIRRLGIIVRYNVIRKEEEILIPGLSLPVDNQLNNSIAFLKSWCAMAKIPRGNIIPYILYLASENPFNPFATWVESKPWDGRDRLELLYRTIVAKDEIKNGEILCMKETLIKTWLISVCAAAYSDSGVSSHGVLVLQGDQGLGKTSWFMNLIPKELNITKGGQILKPDNKDSVLESTSKLIVELGELNATFKKSDIEQLKSFITSSYDIVRPPYAPKASQYPRRTIFCGSVNEEQFLRDPTGNRRFWVIACDNVIYDHGLDMQQVWAEVKTKYYDTKTPYYLNDDLQAALNLSNEGFEEKTSISERIIQTFGNLEFRTDSLGRKTGAWMTTNDVCHEIGLHFPTKSDFRDASSCLKRTFEWKKTKIGLKYLMPIYADSSHRISPVQLYSN